MALTGKVSTELVIQTTAAKFFNLFMKQLHLVQNVAESVHEANVHQGDWHSIGSVKNWTYTVDGKVTTCKENFEAIDARNKSLTFNLFAGDVGKLYKILKGHLQVVDKDDGTAVAKWTYEYEKINENVPTPYAYLDFVAKVTKDVDAHLIKT
ncbi:MLP-like protein 43 [Abrus precatorius]|uniref:MLP-like protein 43 n=1 Tax=Abrus precatorius TaxID=3816 RepID=A0A8B8K0C6_ABRPR|nr:MLP-like protein 43 [Abrus precatorius]